MFAKGNYTCEMNEWMDETNGEERGALDLLASAIND